MCAVSAIVDDWTNPKSPNFIDWNVLQPSVATQMLRVIELLEKIDKKLDAQNCLLKEKTKKKFKKRLKKVAKSK